jgi:two-component system sensor histidine kinase MprB
MSFRMRMVLASLVVGIFAILAASFGAYFASRNALLNSVDDVLQSTAGAVLGGGNRLSFNLETGAITGVPGSSTTQFYFGQPVSQPTLPVNAAVRAVANGKAGPFYTNVRAGGQEQLEYVEHATLPLSTGGILQSESGALQVAAPLTGVNKQLGHLGLALLLVALAAATLAVVLGWLISRTAVGPLNDLTAVVEDLARTTDVSERLEPGGADELGRLRRAFNRLLSALEASRESQHQLVVDASHELRTPLTSLRTNLEIVRRIDELSEPEREVLVADVLTQMQELTNLVSDLAELSRGDHA